MGILCKNCGTWYGADGDGFVSCSIENEWGDKRFITFSFHRFDEMYKVLTGTKMFPNILGH